MNKIFPTLLHDACRLVAVSLPNSGVQLPPSNKSVILLFNEVTDSQTGGKGESISRPESCLCDRGYGHGNWPMPNLGHLLYNEASGKLPPMSIQPKSWLSISQLRKDDQKMKREIYEVHMAYVNKDGYHASDPSGYPKIVDSATAEYNNDTEKALKKAYGYLGAAESTLSTQDHQVGYCYMIRCSDGKQIECRKFGRIADLPDPEPEPTPETEEEEQNG